MPTPSRPWLLWLFPQKHLLNPSLLSLISCLKLAPYSLTEEIPLPMKAFSQVFIAQDHTPTYNKYSYNECAYKISDPLT